MASGVNFGTQQYFGFDPRTIPGCALWLDAADSSTLTLSGSSVTAWNDKSGNGRNATQSVSAQRPTFASSAVSFTGASSNVLALPDNTIPSGNSAYSVYVALTPRSSGIDVFLFSGNATTGQANGFFYTNVFWNYWWDSHINGGSAANGTRTLIEFVYTQNVAKYIYQTGALQSSVAASNRNSGTGNNYIGAEVLRGFYSTCDIHEILVYSTDSTSAQRQQIEGYLAAKWGLSSTLPASHPFKSIPPIMRAFLPTDVLAPTFWLDAADATTFTLSGSAITQWRDKSSSQFTGTSSGSPVQGTLNGRPAVAFNGSQYFDFGDVADLGSANLNMFVVSQFNTTGDGSLIAKSLLGESQSRYSLLREGGSLVILLQGDGATGQPRVGDSSTAPRLLSWTWDRTTQTLYQNGTSILSSGFTSATTFNSAHKLLIGTYNNGNGGTPPYSPLNFNGTIGEVLFLFGTLTTVQRQQVEGYLAQKWGLGSSLPTTHPYRSVLPSTPLFAPPLLSGLTLWLDATDPNATGTLPTNAQSLTSWVDKSGNGYTVSQNASLAVPVFRTGLATNGLPGLDFTGGGGLLSATSFAKSLNVTVFLVGMVRSTIANWGTFWGHFPNGDHDNNAIQLRNTAGQTVINWHTNNNNTTSQLTYTLNSMVLYSCTMTSGNVMFMQQTTTAGTNSVTIINGAVTINTSSAPIWVGRSDLASEAVNSYIYEIVYYQRVLTTTERQQVEGYLAAKWGLQSRLPASHPFANIRP